MWSSRILFRLAPVGLLCLALLAGCASPRGEVVARKDPAFKQKLGRVLIVYHNEQDSIRPLGRKFADGFLQRLSDSLAQKGIPTESVRPSNEELDANAPVRIAIERFHPQQILHFGWIGSSTVSGWSSTGDLPRFTHDTSTKFSFSLIAGPRADTVWRGTISYYVLPDAEPVSDQLMELMAKEGFLGGN